MKDQDGKIIKTKHILEREQDRIEKVKRARENSIQIAMEKSAKLILKERKYNSNVRRHEKLLKEEELYRNDKYSELKEEREAKRRTTIEHDKHLDRLGYERYKKDTKDIEAVI